MPFIEEQFIVNDSGSLAVNNNNEKWSHALATYVTTGGIILLPKGRIYAGQVDITDIHRGLVIQGSGTETKLLNLAGGDRPYAIVATTSNFGYADFVEYVIPTDQITFIKFDAQGNKLLAPEVAANYRQDDVLWLFQSTNNNTRCPFQRRYTVAVPAAPGSAVVTISDKVAEAGLQGKWTKGGRIVTAISADRREVTVNPKAAATEFAVDTWCFLADGAAQNTMYGEFVRVVKNDPAMGLVTFDDYLRLPDYHPGPAEDLAALTALIPGPFLKDLTVRDLVMAGEGSSPVASLFVQGAVGVTLENVQLELGDLMAKINAIGFASCRKVTLTNCRTPVEILPPEDPYGDSRDMLGLNNVQNFAVFGGEIGNFDCEEFSRQVEFHGARLSGDFKAFATCEDVRIFGGNHAFRYATITCDRFRMCGAKFSAVAFGIDGASPGLADVELLGGIQHGIGSKCTNGILAGVRLAPGGFITLAAGSTGYYDGVLGPIGGPGIATWKTPIAIQANTYAIPGAAVVDGPAEIGSATAVAPNNAGFGTPYPTAAGHFKALSPTRAVAALETVCTTDNPVVRTYQDRLVTTDALPATLRAIPLAANTQYLIRAMVLAHKTGGDTGTLGDGALYERVVRAKRVEGGMAILGPVQAPITDEDDANWDCTIVGRDNSAVVEVTGRDVETVAWHLLECQVGSWRTDPPDTNDYRQNLVVYWKLDEGPNTPRRDSTDRHLDLTDFGGVSQGVGRHKGFSAFFNADTVNPKYLMIGNDLALQLGNDTDWYWCGWVYCFSPIPPYSPILAKRDDTDLEYQVHVTNRDGVTGDLTGHMGPQSPPATAIKSGFTADAWHFVEFWHDSANHTLNIDFDRSGAPGSMPASAGLKGDRPLYVGQDNALGKVHDPEGLVDVTTPTAPKIGNYHKGLVDELGLYSYLPPDVIRDGLYSGIRPY